MHSKMQLGAGNSEQLALRLPGEWQIRGAGELLPAERNRLAPIEDCCGNVRSKVAQSHQHREVVARVRLYRCRLDMRACHPAAAEL